MPRLSWMGGVVYRTVFVQTRTCPLPGDPRESYDELWSLLKKLNRKRKVDGVQLRALGNGKVAITLKVYDDDKHAGPLWREIERCLANLREEAANKKT